LSEGDKKGRSKRAKALYDNPRSKRTTRRTSRGRSPGPRRLVEHLDDQPRRATDELRVQFKGGGRYAYEGVPRSVYVEFLSADSRGAFFAERIRGAFKHKKL
jgi:hypothetical protein